MGGIYGPDEKTILGRAFYFMSQSVGYFAFCQKKDLKIDWLHIDNAVQGHVKVKKQKGTKHFGLCTKLGTLDILFLSNRNIHKSLRGLCFWASDPLIERF